MLNDLKEKVYLANKRLKDEGLVCLTWGNVSMIDRKSNLIVIKPSGVSYDKMKLEDMVVCDMNGKVIEGRLKPSVDLLTHIELYKHFTNIISVVHDHSTYATSFAQAKKEIIPLGTTHADAFFGNIPCTKELTELQINTNYVKETGSAIVKRFQKLNYESCPGVLVACHGVFTWGKSPDEAVNNAVTLEECAKMAYLTESIEPNVKSIPNYLMYAHYNRKHGKNHTYGQEEK